MRVLYVINGLGTGGAERSLAEMLPRLHSRGVEPMVACLFRRPEGVEDLVLGHGVDVRFLRSQRLAGRARELRPIIRRTRPRIVHTTIFEADLAGRLAAAGLRVPVVTSLVNTSYEPVRLRDPNVRPSRLRAARFLDGWTGRHLTTHFHAISHAVRDSAVRRLGIPPDRITVIERGRDDERLGRPGPQRRAAARTRLGLGEDDEVLVNLGRHEFQKGHRYLVEAAAALAPSRPRLVTLVAGRDGHATVDLGRLATGLGLDDHLRFLGHREDVPEVLAAADVFVFPSLYEGLGGALIEAMALGLPIVASDLPAIREVVEPGGNALLVPPESPHDLAVAVARLLDDERMRSQFGSRSRALFEERFDIERCVDRMVELYRRLTGNAVPRRQEPEEVAG